MEITAALANLGLEASTLGLLALVAIMAGWVDSIGGGGGLLSIPALLLAGFTPLETLATNKLQASFGSSTAAYCYARQGLVNLARQKSIILLTALGAGIGVILVRYLSPALLQVIIPFLLLGVSIYFFVSPQAKHDHDQAPQGSGSGFAWLIGFGVGFYDGFFGPGAGLFYALGYSSLAGYGLLKATAYAKLLNFISNITALVFFMSTGQVIWLVGFVMGLGQILGSHLGSHLAIRQGAAFIRPVLIMMAWLLSLKLGVSAVQFYLPVSFSG